MSRLFVSIDPPQSIRKILTALDPSIRGVRWTPVDQIHLTLGFFPDVTETVELALREKLNAIEFRAFFLPIKGVGTFPPRGIVKIIWIGVGQGHPHLFQLHKRVQEAALAVGIEPELRPWHPHITLARCREAPHGALRKFLKSNAELDVGLSRVEAFHLYCSQLTPSGPVHTCELSVPATSNLRT
ncbi:MAG TPA: RNA 2',3'-cyclic phosphodiesterase [Chthoniobacterales bacterium]|nr:RNA 2',3'-cyclic phosphodiesterase [Chthoniobacterales bacterium]